MYGQVPGWKISKWGNSKDTSQWNVGISEHPVLSVMKTDAQGASGQKADVAARAWSRAGCERVQESWRTCRVMNLWIPSIPQSCHFSISRIQMWPKILVPFESYKTKLPWATHSDLISSTGVSNLIISHAAKSNGRIHLVTESFLKRLMFL